MTLLLYEMMKAKSGYKCLFSYKCLFVLTKNNQDFLTLSGLFMLLPQPVPCSFFFLIRKVSFLCKKNLIFIFAATMGLNIILDDQLLSCAQLYATPWTVAHQDPLRMKFPGKNTGVGCHFPLQGIFPTWGSNLCLPHWQTLYHLSHQGFLPSITSHAESKGKEGIYCLHIPFSSSK